jgi:hypothetical protein
MDLRSGCPVAGRSRSGTPVLVQSGTPGSRYLYGPNVEDARLRGLRLISYDRARPKS